MTPNEIEALAQVLQKQGISACEVHDDNLGASVKLRLLTVTPDARAHSSSLANAGAPAATEKVPHVMRSPGMGRFSACHPLQEKPAAAPGQRVDSGQTVGYLLVGSLIEEITSPQAAVLGRQLVAEGELVGYGDAVFELS